MTPHPTENRVAAVTSADVRGPEGVARVAEYLPRNYRATSDVDGQVYVVGHDEAGWTLAEYVLPRLASGLIFAEEECATCWRYRGEMHPPHKASSRCQSGGRAHCTCPICWG